MNLRPRSSPPPDINITPLVDVLLVVLLFFMATAQFDAWQELPFTLPTQRPPAATPAIAPILVRIDAVGQIMINTTPVTTEHDALITALRIANTRQPITTLRIAAAARAPHVAVFTVLEAAATLGITQMSFVAVPKSTAALP